MAKKAKAKQSPASLLALRQPDSKARDPKSDAHIFGSKVRCDTDTRGHRTPRNSDPLSLVLHAPAGVVPLWAPGVTLRWRFKKSSLESFQNPAAIETAVEELLAKALLAWGDAVPIKFAKKQENCDFEIVVRANDNCDINGCVLASAFFPDAGQHELVTYPLMFTRTAQEQVETICHEVGHIFGLRHFFAQVLEPGSPSVLFGVHDKFTIMNYGIDSVLTDNDKRDLTRLYEEVWSGERTNINGTPVVLVKPFSSQAALVDSVSVNSFAGAIQPQTAHAPYSGISPAVPRLSKEPLRLRAR